MKEFNSLLSQMEELVSTSSAETLAIIRDRLTDFVENVVVPTRWKRMEDDLYTDDDDTPYWQK